MSQQAQYYKRLRMQLEKSIRSNKRLEEENNALRCQFKRAKMQGAKDKKIDYPEEWVIKEKHKQQELQRLSQQIDYFKERCLELVSRQPFSENKENQDFRNMQFPSGIFPDRSLSKMEEETCRSSWVSHFAEKQLDNCPATGNIESTQWNLRQKDNCLSRKVEGNGLQGKQLRYNACHNLNTIARKQMSAEKAVYSKKVGTDYEQSKYLQKSVTLEKAGRQSPLAYKSACKQLRMPKSPLSQICASRVSQASQRSYTKIVTQFKCQECSCFFKPAQYYSHLARCRNFTAQNRYKKVPVCLDTQPADNEK